MNAERGLDRRLEDRTGLFEQHRRRLRGIVYRMLGSLGDAEDVVQEAYLRWHQVDLSTIRSAEAWLVTTGTRLAIDRLRTVATERRRYVGPWLPEPWPGEVDRTAPDRRLERMADLSIAFLLLLERLTPEERAAFVLREVFEVGYPEVAEALGRTEAACRQLVHRARARMRGGRARFTASRDEHQGLLERLLGAIEAADQDRLLALLAPDAILMSDGGKVRAARNPIDGADRVARFLLGVARKQARPLVQQIALLNGEPGVVRWRDRQIHSTISIAGDAGAIQAVYVMLNPDKLRWIGAAQEEANAAG